MMEHKFTDDEIIPIDINKYAEALNNLIGVDSAYFNGDKDVDAIVEIITVAKKMEGLINRQKAEIERLEKTLTEQFDSYESIRKRAKSDAIKEFAERLKQYCAPGGDFGDPCGVLTVTDRWIDHLVQEMTGEDNGN